MRASQKHVLLVDAGDSFTGRSESQKRKGEVFLRCIGAMDYDALNIGENDLSFGSDFLLEAAREAKIPLVSANLVYCRTGKTLVRPYIIKKYGRIRVAIIGLLDDVVALPRAQAGYDSLVVRDPIQTAKELIPAISKKAHVIVVLAHLGFAKSSKLAREVPGIDVIVTGHNPGVSMEARKDGNALVMMSGARGQYVGSLLLKVSSKKGIVSHDSKLIPLDGRIREDALIRTIIQEYDALEKKLRDERMRKEREESLSRTGQDRYLGSETCRRCHEEIYQKVAAMGHADAFESLEKSQSESLSECLACHTTGYGEPTGFGGASSSADLKDVQCEACHGKGTTHKRDGTYVKVSEKKCLVCHTKDKSPGFGYQAYLRKILH